MNMCVLVLLNSLESAKELEEKHLSLTLCIFIFDYSKVLFWNY
jgi:hypothetical protein